MTREVTDADWIASLRNAPQARRLASEQRGYDRAIAEVVAMLDAYIVENPGAEGALHAKWIKDAIEAGV